MPKMICEHWKTCQNREGCDVGMPHDKGWPCLLIGPCERTGMSYNCIPYKEEKAVEYELVKPISIRALIEAQEDLKCEEFWQELDGFLNYVIQRHFQHSLLTTPFEGLLVEYISDKPKVRDWLIRKGFLREKEEELKPCPLCKSTDIKELGPYRKGEKYFMQIKCMKCGISLEVEGISSHQVRQKWNER